MRGREACKGCSESVQVSDQQLERILNKLALKPELVVSERVYEDRLSLCEDCPQLVYGTTCSQCGCLVKIRARMKDKSCPLPGEPRW